MKIELTESEIIHIMDSLRMRVNDLRDEVDQWGGDEEAADLANELEELEHDLFEASARPNEWTDDLEPTEIGEELFELSAEASVIQAGIAAREQVKATSQAAQRRNFNLKGPDRKLTKTQTHDVWDANDPKNW
jgi:hypothetical protein